MSETSQEKPTGLKRYTKQLWLLLKWIVFPFTTSMEIEERWKKSSSSTDDKKKNSSSAS